MAIAEVIKFSGSPDQLVWKFPVEDFNTTSQLIVDETHEALLVINGNAADLFGPGRHTLSTNNIPLLRNFVEIATGGVTPFPCKVFFVNKVHQMDMKWGTQSAIPLEDPLYDIFMHVMLHGSISVSVDDTRKFLLKMVGFRDRFDANGLVSKFRGIISSHVKDAISKIMIDGKLSYFMMSSHLLEISDVVKEKLAAIFEEYGVIIEFFNIEAIEVPDKDYAEISHAKKLRTGRLIQGYTWQEERQMMIAEKFASNEGMMGAMGGVMGGAIGGVVMGNTISEVARNALSPDKIPTQAPPKNVADIAPPVGVNANPAGAKKAEGEWTCSCGAVSTGKFCMECGAKKPEAGWTCSCGAVNTGKFCMECGAKKPEGEWTCSCGTVNTGKFCMECGAKKPEAGWTCTCGTVNTGKFCMECGKPSI